MKITHFIVCILITLLIGSTRITAQEATKPDTAGAGPGALPEYVVQVRRPDGCQSLQFHSNTKAVLFCTRFLVRRKYNPIVPDSPSLPKCLSRQDSWAHSGRSRFRSEKANFTTLATPWLASFYSI